MKAAALFSFAFPGRIWYIRARRHESGILFSACASGGSPGAGRHYLVAQYLDGQALLRAQACGHSLRMRDDSLKRLPVLGDEVTIGNLKFVVEGCTKNRITKVHAYILDTKKEPDEENTEE